MTHGHILSSLVAVVPLLVAPATAQVGTVPDVLTAVEGRVLDAETGAPIAGAIVSHGAPPTENRATTDADGRFALRVTAGIVAVHVTAAGYFPLTTTLDVGEAGLAGAELSLAQDAAYATSVDVVAAAPDAAPAIEVVAPTQVLRTPGALDNIYRTLQTLPGVSATEEFGSRLAVRGGFPDQNLTVMDGVEIHDPYRLFGLTSAFNPETIQRFDLATGGFSVEYGDRLSSLLIVENRDGQVDRGVSGSASLSISDANVVLEGASGLRFLATETRWRRMGRACKVVPGFLTCSVHFASPRAAAPGCRTVGTSDRGGRSRRVYEWITRASRARRCSRRECPRR